MSQIFIEARTATFLGVPVIQKHLYLVYRDDGGSEWVIRGAPDGIGDIFGGDFLFEINREIDLSSDARGSDTPADRFSTELIIPGKTGDEIWAIMVKYALLLDEIDYPYHSLSTNSNALIGALITAAGGSALDSLPTGVSLSEVFGYDSYSQIVADVVPPLDGSIVGTNQADPIVGIQIAEVFYGLGGNDVIFADAGNDTVYGGSGSDQIRGGPGNDILKGMGGNDTLAGQDNNDRLIGGTGRDVMAGGAGADDFDFNAAGETGTTASTRDRITDFTHLTDDIDLSTIDANGGAAGNTAFSFRATEGAAFTGARGQLRWFQQDLSGTANDKTFIAGDINGDAVTDFQIELAGLKTLTAADFFL